ncbi:MAG: hypothetical protein HYX35_02070 [Proteobacteria bacterium]|nr:hypothetical protein [Pseudomonadota bacterium]
MKPYFFLSAFVFLVEGGLEAQNYNALPPTPSESPSVTIPADVVSLLLGKSDYLNRNPNPSVFDCSVLLNKTWTYSNAQMFLVCGEAETACIRYGIIQQTLLTQQQEKSSNEGNTKGFSTESLKSALSACRAEVEFKLMGCATALQSVGDSNSLINQSGFAGPTASQQMKNSSSTKSSNSTKK